MMMRRLDLPVRYILVGKRQYLNNDLKAPEKSAKAGDNRVMDAYLALVVSRNVIGSPDSLGDWSNT